jgi:excisionase family DNA binding protein
VTWQWQQEETAKPSADSQVESLLWNDPMTSLSEHNLYSLPSSKGLKVQQHNAIGHAQTDTPTPTIDPLLTAVEAARILRLHHVTVLRWAREGRIPHLRLGRKVVFPLSQLTSWLASGYTDSAVRAA